MNLDNAQRLILVDKKIAEAEARLSELRRIRESLVAVSDRDRDRDRDLDRDPGQDPVPQVEYMYFNIDDCCYVQSAAESAKFKFAYIDVEFLDREHPGKPGTVTRVVSIGGRLAIFDWKVAGGRFSAANNWLYYRLTMYNSGGFCRGVVPTSSSPLNVMPGPGRFPVCLCAHAVNTAGDGNPEFRVCNFGYTFKSMRSTGVEQVYDLSLVNEMDEFARKDFTKHYGTDLDAGKALKPRDVTFLVRMDAEKFMRILGA